MSNTYSNEQLDSLHQKYTHLSKQIAYLKDNLNYFARQYGSLTIADQAMNQLLIERLRTEVEIEVLTIELK